eukprot:s244_g19.t1
MHDQLLFKLSIPGFPSLRIASLSHIAAATQAAFTATQRLLSGGLVCAGHDRSDGGLLTAVLEMAFAGRVGVELKLDDASPGSYMEKLFNEAPGLVYEVRRSDLPAVLRVFEAEGVAVQEIGATRKDLRAVVHVGKECVLDGDVASLHCIWEATSFQLERQQCDVPCVEQEEAGFKNRRVPPYKLTYTPEPTTDAVLNSGRKHRVAIVRQEGSNGDREMAAAFHMAGFEAWDVHMTDLLEGRTSLEALRCERYEQWLADPSWGLKDSFVIAMAYAPLLPLSIAGARQTGPITPVPGTTLPGRVPQIGFTPPASRVIPVPQNGSSGKDLDVVQFFSKVFYVSEQEASAVVRVIRIGSLQGSCSVRWKTEEFSAKDGRKYHGGSDVCKFGPGESVRSFEIGIINDENFDTALEFDVVLSEPQNCILDPKFHSSSVMILDDDLFPSNDFREEIEAKDENALYEVGFSLLWSFMKFCFVHVDDIWWKTILVLLLANLGNAYYLATIFIKVYLIDTVLNLKDEHSSDRLWIPGDRNATAICLGLAWVLPNLILLGSDYFEMKVLEMGFNIRYHLRVNLFRKYLRYTKESRAMVPIQDLKISIMEDIPDMVSDGYLILFELWAMLGKIAMVTIFMLKKTPGSALAPLAVYPILIAVYLTRTYKRRLELMAKEGEGQSATIGTLMHAHNNHKLINAYEKKTTVVRYFENVLMQQRKGVMDLKSFTFWNAQLIPWITLLAIGFYIGASAKMVLGGRISLGALVTTINVYKDLGDRFSTILDGLKALSKAISPLSGLTIQFNLETDIPQRAKIFEMNQQFALEYGNQLQRNFDAVPLALEKLQLDQSPLVKTGAQLTVEAAQGTVVQIIGPHDSGKGAILRRICDLDSTMPGVVKASPHLTILQVPHEPLFLEGGGVFANLHMAAIGQKGFDPSATARGRRILQRLGLGKSWIMEQYDQGETSGRWAAKLSCSIHCPAERKSPEGHPFKELDLNPAAVYTKKFRMNGEASLRARLSKSTRGPAGFSQVR